MTGHGAKFGRKKEEAIAALLSQRTVEDAARVVGIGSKTLWRWLQVPEFEAEYRKARRQAVRQATARLQHASGAAVSILLAVMLDGNSPASSRIRAVHEVLGISCRAVEDEDVEIRLAELERAVGETQKQRA